MIELNIQQCLIRTTGFHPEHLWAMAESSARVCRSSIRDRCPGSIRASIRVSIPDRCRKETAFLPMADRYSSP